MNFYHGGVTFLAGIVLLPVLRLECFVRTRINPAECGHRRYGIRVYKVFLVDRSATLFFVFTFHLVTLHRNFWISFLFKGCFLVSFGLSSFFF